VTHPDQALGQWPNAPLAIVLAQIRFDPEVGTEYPEAAERIKSSMGHLFQGMKSVRQFSFVMGSVDPDAPPRREEIQVGLELRSDDDRRSLRIQDGVATYTTSLYKDSIHFLAEWRSMLELLCPPGGLKVLRLGLRYVDFIIPSTDKEPEDYFDDGFARSPNKLGTQAPAVFLRYDYPKPDDGLMRIQYGRGFALPELPPDLEGSVLPPPSLVQKYVNNGPSAVLDIDHWRTFPTRMQAQEIAMEFQRLRNDISTAFKSIITESAEAEWSGKPVQGDENA
jgi:uncharacterized protein (TIGR04255 family)